MVEQVILAGLAGAATWTFLEYVIHRWLGHDVRLRPNPFAMEHIRHHSQGDYFAPTWKKVVITAIVGAVLTPIAIKVTNPVVGPSYVAGLLLFYTAYEVVHRRMHTHAGIGSYGRWLRRHHFYHHFVNPDMNHGIISPVWDIVFRTYRPVGTIDVPHKMRMSWLVDPKTGNVIDDYAGTFQLRQPQG